jgi:4-hydroxythreonine-4-phosphate dehydrogenase
MERPVIAITMGDPAGIGPEIILKAMDRPQVLQACQPLIVGDPTILEKTAHRLGRDVSLQFIQRPAQIKGKRDRIYLHPLPHPGADRVVAGKPDPEFGRMVLDYIRRAARWAIQGKVEAVVTAPISKAVIQQRVSNFSGQTEFLARLSKTRSFGMMLAGGRLRVSLVTIHLPLKKALREISREKILQTIELTHRTLTKWFGIRKPLLAVAGLNPHAGEKGAFGLEEETIIQPAVEAARDKGIKVSGPYPADTLFYWAAQGRYEAVVALYHDQGLIPLKLLHFENAVNLTMGLPFIRTSVDHGTAYDIAGQGRANPDSLVAAILMAAQFASRRSRTEKI